METSVKGIYAIGDMAGNRFLAHKAMAEGVVASRPSRAGACPVDYGNVPSCTYCRLRWPPSARAKRGPTSGREIAVGAFPFTANGKAVAMGEPSSSRSSPTIGRAVARRPHRRPRSHRDDPRVRRGANRGHPRRHHPHDSRPPHALRGRARGDAGCIGPSDSHLGDGLTLSADQRALSAQGRESLADGVFRDRAARWDEEEALPVGQRQDLCGRVSWDHDPPRLRRPGRLRADVLLVVEETSRLWCHGADRGRGSLGVVGALTAYGTEAQKRAASPGCWRARSPPSPSPSLRRARRHRPRDPRR